MSTTPQTIESFNPDLSAVLSEIEESHYLFIIVDKRKAFLFLFDKGSVAVSRKVIDPRVPKKVKVNSGDLYGRNTKLAHKIDNELHQHVKIVVKEAETIIKDKHINGVFLGGHKPLFHIIMEELPKALQSKVRGKFMTELKIPEEDIIAHAQQVLGHYLLN